MTNLDGINGWDLRSFMKEVETADLSDVEKLAEAFGRITASVVEHGKQQVELARAMQDKEALVKEQIKLGVMQHAQGIFDFCYENVTGRKAWDD